MNKSNTLLIILASVLGLSACGTPNQPVEVDKNALADVDYSRTTRVIHVSESGTTDTREPIKTAE